MKIPKTRRRRLKAIDKAVKNCESAILTLRQHFKVKWANDVFGSIYYLQRLAKKAP